MEIIKGDQLIVSADNNIIAAAKSCTLKIKADTIKVGSSTNGAWEHSIVGRKSWELSTSHLLPNVLSRYKMVKCSSPSWGDNGITTVSYNGQQQTRNTRGLHLYYIDTSAQTPTVSFLQTFDTNGSTSSQNSFITALGYLPANYIGIVVSKEIFTITSEMATAIETNFHIPAANVPLIDGHGAVCMIGNKATDSKGIVMGGTGRGLACHASMYIVDNKLLTVESVFKNFMLKGGNTYSLRIQRDSVGDDYLTGNAICKSCSISGNSRGILTGSFAFEGTGPLQ